MTTFTRQNSNKKQSVQSLMDMELPPSRVPSLMDMRINPPNVLHKPLQLMSLNLHPKVPSLLNSTLPDTPVSEENWLQSLRRAEWENLSIPALTQTLILGDSNLRRMDPAFSPPLTRGISLSGAKWEDLLKLIPLLHLNPEVGLIIVHMGYNDLRRGINPVTPQKVYDLLQTHFPNSSLSILLPIVLSIRILSSSCIRLWTP